MCTNLQLCLTRFELWKGKFPFQRNSRSEKAKLSTISLNSVEPVLLSQHIQTRGRKPDRVKCR